MIETRKFPQMLSTALVCLAALIFITGSRPALAQVEPETGKSHSYGVDILPINGNLTIFNNGQVDPEAGKSHIYGVDVLAINGNVIICNNGMAADISSAT